MIFIKGLNYVVYSLKIGTYRIKVSNPVFAETEKPGNQGFFQKRKNGYWLPENPLFRLWILTYNV